MSAKLNKALEFANYLIQFNNPPTCPRQKLIAISYSINGGTFTIDRELITFCKALLDAKKKKQSFGHL